MTRHKILLLIILLLAALLRIYGLGAKSLWLDEVSSVRRVRGTLGQMIAEVAAHDGHPPGYYILQYGAQYLGKSELAARIPSVLAGIALIFAIYLLGRELFDRRTGLIAAGLASVSSFLIYYAQEARPYSLTMLLGCLSLWLFVRILKKYQNGQTAGWPEWIAYTLVGAAGLYTYYYLSFLLLAEGLALVVVQGKNRPLIVRWVVSRLAVAVLFAPYVPVFLQKAAQLPGAPEQSRWQVLLQVPSALARMITGADLAWLNADFVLAGSIFFLAFAPTTAAIIFLRSKKLPLAVMLSAVFVPFLCLIVLPWRLQIFEPKHLAFVAPVLFVLPAYLLVAKVRHSLAWTSVGMVALMNVFSLADYYNPSFQRAQWPQATKLLAKNLQSGDAVYFNPGYLQYPFAYYYPASHPQQPLVLIQKTAQLQSPEFKRLWLIGARNSNVAIPDLRIPAYLEKAMKPAEFTIGQQHYHHVALPGYKGTIVISLYERQ